MSGLDEHLTAPSGGPEESLAADELTDTPASWPVTDRQLLAHGAIADYTEDTVATPDGESIRRQYLLHAGAVAVIALDDQERAVLVRQYRHPVRHRLIEPPAGILDVPGENPLRAAQRELAEEVGLAADDWRVLVDLFTSPGISAEGIRIYLARELRTAPAPEGFVREGEEADMDIRWAPLSELVAAVLAGRLQSPTLVSGVLAAWTARQGDGYDALRLADAPWPARAVRPS